MAQILFTPVATSNTQAYNRVVTQFLSNTKFAKEHTKISNTYWDGLISQDEFYGQTFSAALDCLKENEILSINNIY